MNSQKTIAALLGEARDRMVDQAARANRTHSASDKAEFERRRLYVSDMLEEFKSLESQVSPPKRVFVSFAKSTGMEAFEAVKARLESQGFEVATGFDRTKADRGYILRRVLTQMRRSTIYVGLLTKTLEVTSRDKKKLSAPSVWTVEEKGMALALGKPVVLMVEDGIHEDFWQKVLPHKVHHVFSAVDFQEKMEDLIADVSQRYKDAVEREVI